MAIRKWKKVVGLAIVAVWVSTAQATVFINEVAINPPGSLDDLREFIELQGTPGRKLDGYAIAFLNGGLEKYFPSNSIPPLPDPKPEIDEFFSLDGLQIGPNGLLVISLGDTTGFPELLSDTNFFGPWIDLWNGGVDIPNRLSNDGSNTILLIRRRPGRTQADPLNPGGLRWGKTLYQDFELFRNVIDPRDSSVKDQWGDGDFDRGQTNGLGSTTRDMIGIVTPALDDDLEVVDEVSYESERGWEYDTDGRIADLGSGLSSMPERRVHALDDPQGFNPDSLSRVDYRTTGPGWPAAPGATGGLPSGNNWQDTATEQWIRGENDPNVVFSEDGVELYYWNDQNPNPDSIQPYMTNVPRWLNDGVGTDYNFNVSNSYRLMAGRINPLAIPYIPGDVDRDGDCDASDIARIASVFGDEDWPFSNAYPEAPEFPTGDLVHQLRPWDLDTSGDHGIEPSDLQWALNFQGNTSGRVVGRRYDSTTPSAAGVHLSSISNVQVSVSVQTDLPDGRPLSELRVGDGVELTIRVQVTGGARTSPPDQTNGVMQFVHDVSLLTAGVMSVESVTPISPFVVTRSSLIVPNLSFDRGVRSINGYTTSFGLGLTAPVPLYRVILRAVGKGSTQISVAPAALTGFSAGTPHGIKVGRTTNQGNPNSAVYPAALAVSVTQAAQSPGNCDDKPQITAADFACLSDCLQGPGLAVSECESFDLDEDDDIDLQDASIFMDMFGQ